MDKSNASGIGISTANIHLNKRCNARCRFCFASNLSDVRLSPREWCDIIDAFPGQGIAKVNFAGGEPLLYDGLDEICAHAKALGLTTSVVTNGKLVDETWVESMSGILDMVGLSIDSTCNETEILLGRAFSGERHIDRITDAAGILHRHGIAVKLNVTVVRQSVHEDFSRVVRAVDPCRLKFLRVLPIGNMNGGAADCTVCDSEFLDFRARHRHIDLSNGQRPVFEDNDDMRGSYLMYAPDGRMMSNIDGDLRFEGTDFDGTDAGSMFSRDKFLRRGGDYMAPQGVN